MNNQSVPFLLVEDDPAHILLFQRALRKAAMPNPLQIVSTGEAAVAYLNGEGIYSDRLQYPLPHLVWLDLNLPCLSGFEVLEWLKQQPALQWITIIIVSSSENTSDVEQAKALGASAYLIKPINSIDLVRLVETYVSSNVNNDSK
jgi:CheY-like chemotaxis protein